MMHVSEDEIECVSGEDLEARAKMKDHLGDDETFGHLVDMPSSHNFDK